MTLRPSRFVAMAVAAVVLGTLAALGRAWVCDDAFISFRYAAHLVAGEGLVFNPGERVEGFSNPSWTTLMALGLALGLDPETWSIGWGLAFHAATLTLLAASQARAGRRWPEGALPLPLAALTFAVQPDAAVHATSGLETAAYGFFVFASWYAVTASPVAEGRRYGPGPQGYTALAGLLAALAALTRPDGVLFAAIFGAHAVATAPRDGRLRSGLAFAGAFAALWAPATLARVAYFGDYFPNTYYAKSADRSWFEQGFTYVGLYLQRYWGMGLAFALGAAALLASGYARARRASAAPGSAEEVELSGTALAAVAALVHVLYVARVGGDFMFARMLLPATPLLLVVGEFGLGRWLDGARARGLAAALLLLVTVLTPSPVSGTRWVAGIADEWDYYENVRPTLGVDGRTAGLALRPYFRDLPIGMAFIGAEARLVYYAAPRVAVESEAGLTDAVVAHSPLPRRGRVGHEKRATPDYLLRRRNLLLAFHPAFGTELGLDAHIPYVPIRLGEHEGRLLRWDPALLAALRARGAVFPDLPTLLDTYLARASALPRARVREDYARFRTFYFAHVEDPRREAAFRALLEAP